MTTLFWFSVAGIALAYAGYPAVLAVVGAVRRRPIAKGAIEPAVSILIAAHNEADDIEATIKNKLELDYPAGRREIIVVSDGSTDGTDDIVRRYESRGVRLLTQNPRRGKTAALNWAATVSTGEILVFSDANSIYRPDALRRIVANFADPSVGYVTGKMLYADASGSIIGSGCSAYMRYENVLRELETRVGSVVGVDGGVDAVRRSLYEPMREDLLPDFILPLRVAGKGRRVVYEPEAVLIEQTLTETSDEVRMRVRVILRSYHALWFMKRLLNPFRTGFFAFQLFAHKILRYLVGVLQLTALVSSAAVAGRSPFYAAVFAVQVVFYLFALGGFLLRRGRAHGLFRYPYYLCLLNGAALMALWKFLKGDNIAVWTPRKG
ncbi:MAG: glycosyltransferase family 2 protein [Elusimicrobia bacterium]|nr:glycosyltransferase family 2 protein [Elusimicrobiota bacterium]